jgi:large subunit ribosomal protein L15
MPLYRRLAHRGFSNYPFKKVFQIVNLGEIDKRFAEGETVDEISLFGKRLIKGRKSGEVFKADFPVKILGDGDLTKRLIFKISSANGVDAVNSIDAVSASAREKIQKSGGELVTNG